MGVKIGVVCEGAHDFSILDTLMRTIASEGGIDIDSIECIQPELSATFQSTGGGWGRAKLWCETSGGKYYRRFIDQPLFSNSTLFDILVIHLDGDVVTHCQSHPFKGKNVGSLTPDATVAAMRTAIKSDWLSLEAIHDSKVVACVPVQHMEAWLLAGISPLVVQPEARPTKQEFLAVIARKYRGARRLKYLAAAREAALQLARVRNLCASYRSFEGDLMAAAAVA